MHATALLGIRWKKWNGSDSYPTILAPSVSGSTWTWDILSTQATIATYRIRIVRASDGTLLGTDAASHNDFAITAYPANAFVLVIQPNGGENWERGSTKLISWTSNLGSETYDISLKHYNSSNVVDHTYPIATNVAAGGYAWTIDKDINNVTIPAVGNYKILIEGHVHTAVNDLSDAYFNIILQPIIELYPNPSTTSVTLKFNEKDNENYTITLYNRYNMRIMVRKVSAAYTKQIRINTFDLPNGIYFLRLTSGKQVISRKIIVQH